MSTLRWMYMWGKCCFFALKAFCLHSIFQEMRSINTENRAEMLLFCLECADHFCLAADLTIMCNRFQKYTFCLSIHRRRVFRSFHLADVFMEIHFLWWKVWVWPCSISQTVRPSRYKSAFLHGSWRIVREWCDCTVLPEPRGGLVWCEWPGAGALCCWERHWGQLHFCPRLRFCIVGQQRKCLARHTRSSAQFLQSIMEIVWWTITNHTRLSPIHAGLEFERVEKPGHCIS